MEPEDIPPAFVGKRAGILVRIAVTHRTAFRNLRKGSLNPRCSLREEEEKREEKSADLSIGFAREKRASRIDPLARNGIAEAGRGWFQLLGNGVLNDASRRRVKGR